MKGFEEAERVEKLTFLLHDQHSSQGFSNNLFGDVWAYLALGTEGQIDAIKDDARIFLLDRQISDGDNMGAWDSTYPDYPDFMATSQAVRSLTYLKGYATDADVAASIKKGLD